MKETVQSRPLESFVDSNDLSTKIRPNFGNGFGISSTLLKARSGYSSCRVCNVKFETYLLKLVNNRLVCKPCIRNFDLKGLICLD